METEFTLSEVKVRRRGEYATVQFDLGECDRDKLPHTVSCLENETLCLDLYWQPIQGATYYYCDREWSIQKVIIFPGKKGSRQKKLLPLVILRLQD